jgi:signal peptidase I
VPMTFHCSSVRSIHLHLNRFVQSTRLIYEMGSNEMFTMRIVGMPGKTVTFTNGGIAIDGKPIGSPPDAPGVTYAAARSGTASPYVVPPNCYFMLGDNSLRANDSRFWGALPRTNILGRVTY